MIFTIILGASVSALAHVTFAAPSISTAKPTVSTWIPYWSQQKGIPTLLDHLKSFDSISPFAYEVQTDGSLKDKSEISSGAWDNVFYSAKNDGIKIIPSLLWGDKYAIHNVLSDNMMRANHIKTIVSLVNENKFDGVEIDYEGKLYTDKDIFSLFLNELSGRLKSTNKKLVCTIEARMSDYPASTTSEKALFPWANDYAVLGKTCDEVRIMAYDEYFTTYGSNSFVTYKPTSVSVANASIQYDKKVLSYATSRIDARKITLGIPTYGYEFSVLFNGARRTVKRVRALSYKSAVALAGSVGASIQNTTGGEKFFVYKTKNGVTRYVVFSDYKTISSRIKLAAASGVGGVALFKIDGEEDSRMWNVLK